MTYPNQQLVQTLLPLMQKQMEAIQRELGWLLTGMSNRVSHSNPDIRREIQDRLDASMQGLTMVYLFALWEEYVERDVEREWLPAEKLERLNAFRHVRHCAAHGFGGARADKCRTEFEAVMNSDQPFPNLPWSSDSIDLTKSQVAIDCMRFMEELGKEIIGRVANNNPP